MLQEDKLQKEILEMIKEGLSYLYLQNSKSRSRSEITTAEILHILRKCGESTNRPHWKVPREWLIDNADYSEDGRKFNWSNNIWPTGLALMAIGPTVDTTDPTSKQYFRTKGAVEWVLENHGGWKATWEGELWETCIATLGLLYCKKSGLVSGSHFRWLNDVVEWIISTSARTRSDLGFHYIGMVLWTLQAALDLHIRNKELRKTIRTAQRSLADYIMKDQFEKNLKLVLAAGSPWMTGALFHGIAYAGLWPLEDMDFTSQIINFFKDKLDGGPPRYWEDIESTYYVMLCLIELYIQRNSFIYKKEGRRLSRKNIIKKSKSELFNKLHGLRDSAPNPIPLISPGCPLGLDKCPHRDQKKLDRNYSDENVFLAIPFTEKYKDREQRIIDAVLRIAGLNPVISDPSALQDKTSTNILCQICQRIGESRYGLADLSYIKKTNIAYELGLLHAFNRKTGLLLKEEEKNDVDTFFADIRGLQYHVYPQEDDKLELGLACAVAEWILAMKISPLERSEFISEMHKEFPGIQLK